MLIRLMQGFGRLIRTESDVGVVSVLDARVAVTGMYRQAALEALPTVHAITDNKEVIKDFIDQNFQGVTNI